MRVREMTASKVSAAPLVSFTVNPNAVLQSVKEGKHDSRPRFIEYKPPVGKVEDVLGGECLCCGERYEHRGLGICTDMRQDETDEPKHIVKNRKICSPPCLIAYLAHIHIPARERDGIERMTLAMLRSLYGQSYVPVATDAPLRITEPLQYSNT